MTSVKSSFKQKYLNKDKNTPQPEHMFTTLVHGMWKCPKTSDQPEAALEVVENSALVRLTSKKHPAV